MTPPCRWRLVVLVALICTPFGRMAGSDGSVEQVPDSPHGAFEQLHQRHQHHLRVGRPALSDRLGSGVATNAYSLYMGRFWAGGIGRCAPLAWLA